MPMQLQEQVVRKAEELGRLISQTPEMSYLKAARSDAESDADLSRAIRELSRLEAETLKAAQQGEEPTSAVRDEYARLRDDIQTKTRFQALVAAESNYHKMMERVSKAIEEGISKARSSGIIIPS